MTSIFNQRNLGKRTDVLIIGGGIVGCGLLRDLSLHNIDAVLIDKKDFTSQTSNSSSKMLHGGIRYLENFDFKLVFEALHEKNLWLKLAPHLAKERKFYLPTFSDSKRPLWMLKIGLFLYDFLSSFQNRSHQMASASQTLKDLNGIRSKGLKGAGIYYDAVVDDGKLTLEVLYDAILNPKCRALNYVSLIDLKVPTPEQEDFVATLKDELTGETTTLLAKDVVFATGPFTDQVLGSIEALKWKPCLLPSKGSHLWISKQALPVTESLVMVGKDDRVIFVIPWHDKVLVGTTEKIINGEMFDLKPSQEEITYLLDALKDYFPDKDISNTDILGAFAGVRPLVKESDTNDLGKTAREHKVFSPHERVRVIVGGKYTTFRVMVQEVARELCLKNNQTYSSEKTKRALRQPSIIPAFSNKELDDAARELIWRHELPRTEDDLRLRRAGKIDS
tara:strand:- start:4950 stop:6293 length:1344 start_codon:yes stop_codon:yes gene_type:complete